MFHIIDKPVLRSFPRWGGCQPPAKHSPHTSKTFPAHGEGGIRRSPARRMTDEVSPVFSAAGVEQGLERRAFLARRDVLDNSHSAQRCHPEEAQPTKDLATPYD